MKIKCPVCGKEHQLREEIDILQCRDKLLALIKDRHGWRLIEIKIIDEKQEKELDRIWGSE